MPTCFAPGSVLRQPEPVWGGSVDTAVDVRVSCAMGLVNTRYPRALIDLVGLLADPEPRARAGAARAIACAEPLAAEAVLRIKALTGDAEAEVVGECLVGLLQVEPEESPGFVAGFLDDRGPGPAGAGGPGPGWLAPGPGPGPAAGALGRRTAQGRGTAPPAARCHPAPQPGGLRLAGGGRRPRRPAHRGLAGGGAGASTGPMPACGSACARRWRPAARPRSARPGTRHGRGELIFTGRRRSRKQACRRQPRFGQVAVRSHRHRHDGFPRQRPNVL